MGVPRERTQASRNPPSQKDRVRNCQRDHRGGETKTIARIRRKFGGKSISRDARSAAGAEKP
jgi:hypothetical protein